jgi:hypothetical protein
MLAPGGEHLAHLLAWALQSRMTVKQMLEMPYYHPVLEEHCALPCTTWKPSCALRAAPSLHPPETGLQGFATGCAEDWRSRGNFR